MRFKVGDIVRYNNGYDYVIYEVLEAERKYIIKFARPFSRAGKDWSAIVMENALRLKSSEDK
jgi:hypothetical protein